MEEEEEAHGKSNVLRSRSLGGMTKWLKAAQNGRHFLRKTAPVANGMTGGEMARRGGKATSAGEAAASLAYVSLDVSVLSLASLSSY